MFPFYTPENTRKPNIFRCFQGVWNENTAQKWVKPITIKRNIGTSVTNQHTLFNIVKRQKKLSSCSQHLQCKQTTLHKTKNSACNFSSAFSCLNPFTVSFKSGLLICSAKKFTEPAGVYLFKVNNRNNRKCVKLTMKVQVNV